MFERFFISKFKNCRLHRAEVHRVLWKIKEFVYFCGSVQPISPRTFGKNSYQVIIAFKQERRNLFLRSKNLELTS